MPAFWQADGLDWLCPRVGLWCSGGVEVIVLSTAEEAVRLVARVVARSVRARPDLVLGLATGRTMEGVYRELVRLHREEGLDFSRCRTFNLDEYVGVSSDDPRSFRHWMQEHFFRHVNLQPANVHLPDGMAADLEAECLRYEEQIRAAGGVDLQLLGIGRAGHIGFNEPLSSLQSRTRVKMLTPVTIRQNAAACGGEDRVPRRAVTMGVGTILEARWCVLVALGLEKAEVVARAVEGPITSMVPASALQLHPRCTVVLDEAAASLLSLRDYCRWLFENEPDWAWYRQGPAGWGVSGRGGPGTGLQEGSDLGRVQSE
ncbi:glucosamine-6-phosphate deaminase [Limisphaera ngatamarikiensis]|uniref:Glucosamine-6-phosphate deaminase n=1 Tax=Limisphaera ngatamarikiensis TaxID=1324935 RepID=A0A6M1RLR3_9BACT|nr:glucosamine-6-phosphate deaminase [Limisphaera ngatamarikiensis]NGO38573.1 glucosamine-6-phosphate deaminase [Limisphaera ngatamarikiensis]